MDNNIGLGIFLGMVGTIILMVLFIEFIVVPVEYKRGQKDALTGNIKYELVTAPDSTRTWEEIDK